MIRVLDIWGVEMYGYSAHRKLAVKTMGKELLRREKKILQLKT
jgi:hypothetical protein